jgi:hypothetical protein
MPAQNFCSFPNIIVGNYARNLSREKAIKQSNLRQQG